jgi:hypothetical protein
MQLKSTFVGLKKQQNQIKKIQGKVTCSTTINLSSIENFDQYDWVAGNVVRIQNNNI